MLFEKVIDFYYNNKNITQKIQKTLTYLIASYLYSYTLLYIYTVWNIIKALSSYNYKRCNE